jgi:hypothetical protein
MLATPPLTCLLIDVAVGLNLLENVKLALHLSLPQFAAQMEKLLQLFQSLDLSNALVVSQVVFMQPL